MDFDLMKLVNKPYINEIGKDIIKDKNEELKLKGRLIIVCSFETYIGPDVTLGLVSNVKNNENNIMYIDLGTNGELCYLKDGEYKWITTAAGPAFEGGNIHNGIGAVNGAIYKYKDKKYKTIDNKEAIGICGSGIIDIISENYESIDETGYLKAEINITNNIKIIQNDIREIQLAKSAIMTHIKYLIDDDFSKIKKFYVAGGFGMYVKTRNCIKIGLLPKITNYKKIGNASIKGALLVLRNNETLVLHQEILKKSIYIEYYKSKEFFKNFVSNLNFKW
jgi:uncharacterized 2Fe-2S/4Fe-4S cluster protein (DUF4445 family)